MQAHSQSACVQVAGVGWPHAGRVASPAVGHPALLRQAKGVPRFGKLTVQLLSMHAVAATDSLWTVAPRGSASRLPRLQMHCHDCARVPSHDPDAYRLGCSLCTVSRGMAFSCKGADAQSAHCHAQVPLHGLTVCMLCGRCS